MPPAFTAPGEPVDDEALPWAPGADAGGDAPGAHTRPGVYQSAWWLEKDYGDPVAEYPYMDATGTLRAVVVRTTAKNFPCYVPATGRWSLGDDDAKQALVAIPYNLPALAADGGVRGRALFVVKGEKDVHAMAAKGLHATTRLGAAKEWSDALSEQLAALGPSQVVVLEDRDRDGNAAGAKKAADACESLRRVLPSDLPVKRIMLPPVVVSSRVKDAADYFAAGGTIKALRAIVEAAPPLPTWLDEYAPRLDVLLADPEMLRPPAIVVPYLAWQGRVTLLAAQWKAGKSTIVGQAAAACTTGAPFLGEPTTRGRVLWYALDESTADLGQRLARLGCDRQMVRITREVPTIETIRRAVKDFRPTLIVVDALSDVLQAAGIDENSPAAGQHMRSIFVELAYETGVAFIVIHHLPNGAKRPRGSGSIPAKADVIVTFAKPERRKANGDGTPQEEEESDDSDPGAPEPRVMRARGRANVSYGVKLQYDGNQYSIEKSPASDHLRALHVLLNHPEGVSANTVVSLLGGQRARVLSVIVEHEAAGYIKRGGSGPASRVCLTEAGRLFVVGQHPDLADKHFPTLPVVAQASGSRDIGEEEHPEPIAGSDPGALVGRPVPGSIPGTDAEPVGNRSEPIAGTACDLFGATEADRFPLRTPRGVSREPIAGPVLEPIEGWDEADEPAGAA